MCLEYLGVSFPLPLHAYKVVDEQRIKHGQRLITKWFYVYQRWRSWDKRTPAVLKGSVNKDQQIHTLHTEEGSHPYRTGFHLWATLDGAKGDMAYGRAILEVTYGDVVATGYQWGQQVIVVRRFRVVKKVKL